jgi:hypothetical protein
MICTTANALWLAGCASEAFYFRRATTRVAEEQAEALARLVRANADTEFGRQHGFPTIRDADEYRRRVPLRTYDEYRPWIARVADGTPNVLTREPVRMFEPTSGSTTANKLVPYTASLQREFQRGIRPWIVDLFRHHPELMSGPSYWSISPAAVSERTRGGIPVGFDDDSCYVGGWQRRLVQAVMAAPATLRHESDMERFRYLTLLSLVRSSRLRLISVWNPTFLSLLVDRLGIWGDELIHDLKSDGRRADVLRAALRTGTAGECHAMLWPHLGMISCWTDANAAAPASQLAHLFPQARIQGKGLIATEGFISLPLGGYEGSALAIRSHFLEFSPVDSARQPTDDRPRLAHELDRGQRYSVMLSTGGGLYRYRLDDVVEVVGRLRQCPLIRFVGRQGHVSDWFGEKLNEASVARVLHEACASFRISPRFAMLACDDALAPPAYVLYIESAATTASLIRLAERIEAELRRSFHYDYARRLTQLGALRVFRAQRAGETYLMTAICDGQRAGQVKPLALDRRKGWSQILRGDFVADVNARGIEKQPRMDRWECPQA